MPQHFHSITLNVREREEEEERQQQQKKNPIKIDFKVKHSQFKCIICGDTKRNSH